MINGSIMNKCLLVVFLLVTLFMSGCSYLFNQDSPPEQVATSSVNSSVSPVQKTIEPKVSPPSCNDLCSKQGGLKKKFCVKKCEFLKKRAEKMALIRECEARKADMWSRIINKQRDKSSVECGDSD